MLKTIAAFDRIGDSQGERAKTPVRANAAFFDQEISEQVRHQAIKLPTLVYHASVDEHFQRTGDFGASYAWSGRLD